MEHYKKYYQMNREKCLKAYRDWYKKHGRDRGDDYYEKYIKPYDRTHRKQKRAKDTLKYHIKNGDIERPKGCEYCKDDTYILHGHHEDYSKPLEVIWLCPMCHKRLHTGLNTNILL